MVSRLHHALGVKLPLSAIFDHPTVTQLAARVASLMPAAPATPGSHAAHAALAGSADTPAADEAEEEEGVI